METVLITGVAGLLGSRLADWIIANKPDCRVIGIDDLSGGFYENVHKDVWFYHCNILDSIDNPNAGNLIEEIFDSHSIDVVYHFAAYAAAGLSPFIRKFNYDNNLSATAKVVNECIKHNVKRLVFTSTMEVYGRGHGGIFDEDMQPAPIGPYGVAKYACEMDIQIAGEQHGLDWCIVRPHNVYGRKQNIWDKYRNVLGIWMYQHLNDEPMTIFGDGTQTRAFSCMDDMCKPFWIAGHEPQASNQIINLGGIHEYTIADACDTLCGIIGTRNVVQLETRHEPKHSVPTYQKSIDLLGFDHKIDLKEGLEDMWKWALKQPMRERYIWPSYELDKGVYSYWKLT